MLTLTLLVLLAGCDDPIDCNAKQKSNPEHVKQLLATKQCPGCDLGGANLRGANLARANLQGAELSGALLEAQIYGVLTSRVLNCIGMMAEVKRVVAMSGMLPLYTKQTYGRQI
ncbi:MAG: pentapeptide repeat-containing protein [Oscillatoriales cyanobacterium C42_A2020_001]|nr:pentapeptide repeat-containing protein [Leptolyngbyaceae cyanobacterium C42_A2020_001]